jgi:hypothetical protein
MFADHTSSFAWPGFEVAPAIKKAVVASPAPRLLKDLVFWLWSFKSRGAAQAPKIIIAKKVGARLPELQVFLPRLLDIHACKPSSWSCQDFFSDIIKLFGMELVLPDPG